MVCEYIIMTEDDDTHVEHGRNDIQPVCYLSFRAKGVLAHSRVISAGVLISSILLYLQSVSGTYMHCPEPSWHNCIELTTLQVGGTLGAIPMMSVSSSILLAL